MTTINATTTDRVDLSTDLSTDESSEGSESLAISGSQETSVKRKRGRPRHLILATTQLEVYELSRVGTRHEDIAPSTKYVRRHSRKVLPQRTTQR